MEDRLETVCRTCGLDVDEVRFDASGLPLFVLCECCGGESGCDDGSLDAVRRYRESWVADGAPWFEPAARPSDWQLSRQLANIPARWR
ncbi:hypothetical protein ACGFS9_17900 [Streptomyces sp. NPDC048566]|uniref:hypothetical protein n=1 Tax=Streptomyces sp. NPDC048566 TaxID=3365569 RepID=UPI003713E775